MKRLHHHHHHGAGFISSFVQTLVLVMLVITAAALYAPLKNYSQLRDDLAAARERHAELKVLYPLYAEIATLDAPEDWTVIQAPVVEALREAEVVEIPARFSDVARACSIELAAVRPRVEQPPGGERFLQVDLLANGPYPQLKDFLVRLARLPMLDRIEQVEVRREGRQEQFHVVAHLALEGDQP
jgi:hypothetical protein